MFIEIYAENWLKNKKSYITINTDQISWYDRNNLTVKMSDGTLFHTCDDGMDKIIMRAFNTP